MRSRLRSSSSSTSTTRHGTPMPSPINKPGMRRMLAGIGGSASTGVAGAVVAPAAGAGAAVVLEASEPCNGAHMADSGAQIEARPPYD